MLPLNPRDNKMMAETLDNIAGFFPYFFTVYVVALMLDSWLYALGAYFSWAAFHACVIILGIASYFSPLFQNFLHRPGNASLLPRLARGYVQSVNARELVKIIVLLSGLIAGIVWFENPSPVVAWAAVLFTALYGIPFKAPLLGSFICLCASIAFRTGGNLPQAESWAIFSYYSFIVAVISEVRTLKLSRQHKGTA